MSATGRPRAFQIRARLRSRCCHLLHGGGTLAEPIFELAVDVAEMAHSAGTCGASPLGLDTPVERALARRRVAARRATALLDVVRTATAAVAQRVRLASALSKARGTFRLRLR